MLQTNSITISVNNDAVNYAKGNTQGIIEIPNRIWSSIISNVTFPDRSFFNRLFINVSGVVNEQTLNVQDKTIDITTNGTRTVTPDVGYQGLGEVTINTNVPSGVNNQNKSLLVTSNGLHNILPDQGYSGIGELNLTVNVPSDINNQVKTLVVNSNSSETIIPDNGYSGIGELHLIVNVPEKRLQSKTVLIDTQGFEQILPDSGYDGFSELSLNVNVPMPVIQENDIRYIVPSLESRQIIVEPNEGYDALEKVTLNISSAPLVTNQNILDITSNGVYNLPSLEGDSSVIGFGDSCTVNVNVNVVSLRYLSFASGGNAPPASKIDLESDAFTGSISNDINIELPEGRALCIIQVQNDKVKTIQFVGNPTGTGDTSYITVSKNKYYREVNYDIGSRVFLLNGNSSAIMSLSTHNIPNKVFLETDIMFLGQSYISSSNVILNVV